MKGACASCGKPLRAGSTRRAAIPEGGGFVNGLVCSRCARRGFLVVPPPPATVAPPCPCGKELAVVGTACVERLAAECRELRAANVALLLARKGEP